ncbi:MAG: hydroxymethylglutaryl-CoA lyase [Rhodothermales bacterium]
MIELPARVVLTEVGMRDGFQFEKTPISTERKLEVLRGLLAAGVSRIQVTSFVHPKWVPQMADAEALCAQLPAGDAVFTGLALNTRGVARAAAAGLTHVDLSISTNDRHSRDNANLSREEAMVQAEAMIRLSTELGLQAQMGFQCVFGYAAPGDTPLKRVVDMARRYAPMGIASLSLADTTGMANPVHIQRVIEAVRPVLGAVPIVLHLHDTRGLGMANVLAALQAGVTHFDTSLGGLGGCPFIPGATGNIATEDTVYLLESMGIETGIDRRRVGAVTRDLEAFLGRSLPGKMHRIDA